MVPNYFNRFLLIMFCTFSGSIASFKWVKVLSPTTENLNSIIWARDMWIVVGENGTVLTSENGVVWDKPNSKINQNLLSVAGNENHIIAIGFNGKGTNVIEFMSNGIWEIKTTYSSEWGSLPDGKNWISKNTNAKYKIKSTNHWMGQTILKTHEGATLSSWDNLTWEITSETINYLLTNIIWTGERFSATGNRGIILESINTTNWKINETNFYNWLGDIATNGQDIVAVGRDGAILKKCRGKKWEKINSGTRNKLFTVMWSKLPRPQWIAAGVNGTILTSKNGTNWKKVNSPSENAINSLGATKNHFFAVGTGGLILVSENASDWTIEKSGTETWLNDISSHKNQIIVIGEKGTILKARYNLQQSP